MRKTKFQNGKYYHIYNRGVDKREVFCDMKDYIRFLKSMADFNNSLNSFQRDYIKRMIIALTPEVRYPKLGIDSRPTPEVRYPKLGIDSRPTPEVRYLTSGVSDGHGLKKEFFEPLIEIICYCLNSNHYHLLLKQVKDHGISSYMAKLGNGYTKYFNYKNSHNGYLFQGKYKAVEIKSDEQMLYVSAYINGNAEIHGIDKADKWSWSSYPDYLEKRQGTRCNKEVILKDFKNKSDYRGYVRDVIKNSRSLKQELKQLNIE